MIVIPFSPNFGRPEVRSLSSTLGARIVDMVETTDYWDLMVELWTGERDLVLWEHDVMPTAGLVAEIAACAHDWCSGSFGHPGPTDVPNPATGGLLIQSHAQLSLNKFSAELQRQAPAIMTEALQWYPTRHFNYVAWALLHCPTGLLQGHRLEPHLHGPPWLRHLKKNVRWTCSEPEVCGRACQAYDSGAG